MRFFLDFFHIRHRSICICIQFNVHKTLGQRVMGDDDGDAGLASIVKVYVDVTRRCLVDVAAYIIKYQNVRPTLEGSGKSDLLLFAAGEICTAVKYLGIQCLIG